MILKSKYILISLVFLLLPIISAYNAELTLNSNVNNFNTDSYLCSSSACSDITFYDSVNSQTSKNIYSLIGSGDDYYAEFDYAYCMIPHIYRHHIWDPYSGKKDFSRIFTQKSECQAIINQASLSDTNIDLGESVSINTNIDSAFGYPDNIPTTTVIPANISNEYSSKTQVKFYANDILISSAEEEILLGSDKDFEFVWTPSQAGTYVIKAKTNVSDCACLSSVIEEKLIGTLIVKEAQCVVNKQFTLWTSWINVSACRPDNSLVQKRTRIEYDSNNCGSFSNVTHEEYQDVSCNYNPTCTENRQFTLWTSWINVSACRPDNSLVQKRTRIEYDSNNCGSFSNVTHEEYQDVSCNYEEEDCCTDDDCSSDYNESICQNDNVYLNIFDYSCLNNNCVLNLSQILKQDCGQDEYGSWSYSCDGKNVTRSRYFANHGCNNAECFIGTIVQKEFVKTCDYNCVNGECGDACEIDSDCQSDYYSDKYCQGDSVYKDYHDFSCGDGQCDETISKQLIEECDEGCKNGRCQDNSCSDGDCDDEDDYEDDESLDNDCIDGICDNLCLGGICGQSETINLGDYNITDLINLSKSRFSSDNKAIISPFIVWILLIAVTLLLIFIIIAFMIKKN